MSTRMTSSGAIAHVVAACHPEVIGAPMTRDAPPILDDLATASAAGALPRCEFVTAGSAHQAISTVMVAAVTGARTYTATTRDELQTATGALLEAARLRLPIVMTVTDSPCGRWNADCGWIQLHAGTAQDAVDLHVQAFRLAAQLALPVMVWVDDSEPPGPVMVPTRAEVAGYLLPWTPRPLTWPGAWRDPDTPSVLARIAALGAEYTRMFGRPGAVAVSRHGSAAATVVVGLGTVRGAVADVVDTLRGDGMSVGAVGLTVFRPFPADQLRDALTPARVVLVLDRTAAIGADVEAAVRHTDVRDCRVVTGMVGEPVDRRTVEWLVRDADTACPPPATAGRAAPDRVRHATSP